MTRPFLYIAAIFSSLSPLCSADPLSLIPLPAQVNTGEGFFQLEATTTIFAVKPEEKQAAEMLALWLRPSTGLPLSIKKSETEKSIQFSLDKSLTDQLGREGYLLECGPKGVTIRAAAEAGLIYGAQTFRQLLPAKAFSGKKAGGVTWQAPAVKIQDRPRFAWRGFMLDVSRHFFTMDDLRSLIDDMSAQKLNLLQLHLTDDDGWRIEIKKYPKLTEIGAWRGTECQLPNTRPGETFKRYGGFYTQKELKELVAYAKARNVDIMPEIDLPGHALAIATAYPESLPSVLSDAVSTQGHKANAISPAKESNYGMIDDIIGEVAEIFPFEYIHIGGDEVNHKIWEACPDIKALMKKENLGNLHQVQVHFTRRLEGIIAKHDRKMIGWQEIADNKLSTSTGIMAWLGPEAGWNAAKRGVPAVMAPGGHCYFDMPYPGAEDEPPAHWWAGPVSLKKAYEFDALTDNAGLDEAAKAKVLGIISALWTEYVTEWKSKSGWLELKDSYECAEYKIWPRLNATAEAAWSPQQIRNYDDFSQRMEEQYIRMAEAGRKFRLEPPTAIQSKGQIRISPPWKDAIVKYTTDGTDPFNSSTAITWDGTPIESRLRAKLAMRSVMPDYKIFSPLTRNATIEPIGAWDVAAWKKEEVKTLVYPAAEQITGPGRWKVRMQKTGGDDGLAVDGMELKSAGKSLASAKTSRGSIILDLKDPATKDLELVVTARFNGEKLNAKGNVIVEQLAVPVVLGITVETSVSFNGEDYNAAQLLDGDMDTYFWSSRPMKAEETVTWVLPEATTLNAVELQTGMPNGTKDQILDAVLEVSSDGKKFTKASGFAYGAAKADLGGKKIKAIRIRATGDSPGWVVLQDLILRK